MRLSVALGLSITAAVYGSSISHPKALIDITFAYDRAYLCSILFAVIGFLFVPFMRIGKQGGSPPPLSPEKEKHLYDLKTKIKDEESGSPRPPSSYRDESSQTPSSPFQPDSNGSKTSFQTVATYGSAHSYFPRWSWEEENLRRDRFGGDEHVVYEVCIKCLEERKVYRDPFSYRGDGLGGGGDGYGYGYEPTPVRGGDLGSVEAKTYEVRLATPREEGFTYRNTGMGDGGAGGSRNAGVRAGARQGGARGGWV
jgi:hypothetical protein